MRKCRHGSGTQVGRASFKTFQIFDLAKRVMHYLNDLDCVTKFSEALGDHCDFQHESLQTLATMQNLHVFGKLVVSLSAAYSLELLTEVFIRGVDTWH